MPTSTRIPPLLEPYVKLPPQNSLTLLTGVLNASTNWLVLRYLCSVLGGGGDGASRASGRKARHTGQDALDSSISGGEYDDERSVAAVVLVSWMRDWEFWKAEARRATGIDLELLRQQKCFEFVDGLSNPRPISSNTPKLVPPTVAGQVNPALAPVGYSTTPNIREQPVRRGPVPARQPANTDPVLSNPAKELPAAAGKSSTQVHSSKSREDTANIRLSIDATSPEIRDIISSAISRVSSAATPRKVLLVLDNPDFLLAANPDVSSIDLLDVLTSLRLEDGVSSALVTCAADAPLLQAPDSGARTPLEESHAAFVTSLAHQASMVMSLRQLDTGWAADVTGVLRISAGGESTIDQRELEEKEVLYHVQGDGNVRVFERGGGG